MSRSQSNGAATAASLLESSADDHQKKRSEAAAELEGRKSPSKKQQIERPVPLPRRNLSAIILAGKTRDGVTYDVSLDAFSDHSIPYIELRPIHFRYHKVRDWALHAMEIPREAYMNFKLFNKAGELLDFPITTENDFTTILAKIWNNVLDAPYIRDLGEVVYVTQHAAKARTPHQPAVEAKKPEEPVPEPEQPSQEPEPTPESQVVIDLTNGDKVLPADTFLDLVREAKTAADQSLKPGEKDEPDADEKLYNIHIRTLKKATIFFNTTLDGNDKCRVNGMRQTLHIWQILTAYRMFTMPITTGLNGLLIGLDVGFGKTMLMLLFVRAKAVICRLHEEVLAEWETEEPKDHLEKDQKGRCPSQDKYMVQCPCSWSKALRRIFDYMSNLPTLIICPPSLRDTWMREVMETYDDFGNKDSLLRFYYFYGYATPGNDLRDSKRAQEFLKATNGLIMEDDQIDVGNGKATDIFFTSNLMPAKLLDLYKKRGIRAAFGAFVMDEMQRYSGSSKPASKSDTDDGLTIPFKALTEITNDSFNPVSIFALCGTIAAEGPGFWEQIVDHLQGQWVKHDNLWRPPHPPDFLKSKAHIAKVYRDLIRDCADDSVSDMASMEKAKEIRHFLRPMCLSLRQNEVWRGKILNPLPPIREEKRTVSKITDPDIKRCMANTIASVETLISTELSKRRKAWDRRKQEAVNKNEHFEEEEPTEQNVIEHQVGIDKPKGAWYDLSRACAYPYLAVLIWDKITPRQAFESKEAQVRAVAVSKTIDQNPQTLHVEETAFENWEFYRHRRKIKDNSPKFLELEQRLINDLVNDDDPDTSPPKDDPCRKRYAIVFCNHTITAVITWFFLITNKELCKVIQPILYTSDIPMDRRQQIVKEFEEKGRPDGRCKILIAVTYIAAEGFNLQRVNNVWFMELPNGPSKYLQARGRVIRTGQTMRVNEVILHDEDNLFEVSCLKTLRWKIAASKLIYNIKEK